MLKLGLQYCSIIFSLFCTNYVVFAQNKCGEIQLLDGSETIAAYGLDTTNHWWAVTQPFSNQMRLWVDGKKSEVYQEVKKPIFSPDGTIWASFGLNQNGVWQILYPDSTIPIVCTEPKGIYFGRNGSQPAVVYAQGDMEMLRWKGKEVSLIQRSGDIKIDCYGENYAYVSKRSGGKVIVYSRGETTLFDDIILFGIWHDGNPIYAASNSNQWRVYIGSEPQSRIFDAITDYALNQFCSIAAFVGKQGTSYTAMLINSEYYEPIESKAYLSIDNLQLHPFSPVFAFRALNQMQIPKIVFSSTEYAAARESSKPQFSYNGEELTFLNTDVDMGVNINGKRFVIQRAIDLGVQYCVKPNSRTICFSTGVAMVMLDVEKNKSYAGLMVQETGGSRYNRFNGYYEALGRINQRLYLMYCKP